MSGKNIYDLNNPHEISFAWHGHWTFQQRSGKHLKMKEVMRILIFNSIYNMLEYSR